MTKWRRIRFQPNLPLGENFQRVTACPEHITLARQAAKDGMVLLKNDQHILPFQAGTRLALFGVGTFVTARGPVEGGPRKPNPALTLSVMHETDPTLTPSECVFVGDSNIDIETAKNVGMYSVGVSWGYRSPELLRELGAERILSNGREIAELADLV